jgi:hypothetical protein
VGSYVFRGMVVDTAAPNQASYNIRYVTAKLLPAVHNPEVRFRLRIVRVLKFRRVASLVPIAASSPESALPPKRALVFFIATAL